jgi:hypothetical protein
MGTVHQLPPRFVHDGVEYRIDGRGLVARRLRDGKTWSNLATADLVVLRDAIRALPDVHPVVRWLRANGYRPR